MTPKREHLQKFPFFYVLMQFLSIIRYVDKKVAKVQQDKFLFSVVANEEINAVFWTEIDPKMKKNQQKSRFLTFLCNLCQIFDRLRGLEC